MVTSHSDRVKGQRLLLATMIEVKPVGPAAELGGVGKSLHPSCLACIAFQKQLVGQCTQQDAGLDGPSWRALPARSY